MNERKKILLETMKKLNKNMGKGFIEFADTSPEKEVIPFGIEALDKFYGGGVVRRKFTVDFGGEDTGKSTRALHLTANAQKLGHICCYIDLERKFDKERAKQLGVDLDDLVLIQTAKTAEESMDAIRILAQEKVVDLIVLDSIQSMSPKGEQETKKGKVKSIEDDEVALLARKLGKFFRVVSPDIFRANIAVYLIGQVRQNLGGFFTFADLSGGNALKHFMSMCTFSRKGQKSDFPVEKKKIEITTPDGEKHKKTVTEVIGFDCVLKMVKSHIGDSVREGKDIHIPFYYNTGFHPPLSISNPHATDEKMLKNAVETSTAIEGVNPFKSEKAGKIISDDVIPEGIKHLIPDVNSIIEDDLEKLKKDGVSVEKPKKRGRGRPKKEKI